MLGATQSRDGKGRYDRSGDGKRGGAGNDDFGSDDVYVENWVDGRKMAFDLSVTSPTQEAVIVQAATHPGAAIDARKTTKNRAHFSNCRDQGIHFQPLVVETFGGWDREATSFLKELARQSARRWGRDSAQEIKFFFQRLSVSLQRGNAALLIDRDPDPAL